MQDLETIAQLLLSTDETNKEIALFLIKSQKTNIDDLYNPLCKTIFKAVNSFFKKPNIPTTKSYIGKDVVTHELSVFGITLFYRVSRYYILNFKLEYIGHSDYNSIGLTIDGDTTDHHIITYKKYNKDIFWRINAFSNMLIKKLKAL